MARSVAFDSRRRRGSHAQERIGDKCGGGEPVAHELLLAHIIGAARELEEDEGGVALGLHGPD